MKLTSSRPWLARVLAGLAALLLAVTAASAKDLLVGAGAGYKKPVTEVVQAFQQESGIKVNAVFGNLQMVATQAKQTGEISCIIGDRKFLDGLKGTLAFRSYEPLGKGILVLAYRKGLSLSRPEDMATDKVRSIFMPEDKKAIYGIAGSEALRAYGYDARLKAKVTQVATVPQVISYLLAGEADTGLVNLTEAMANHASLGGYLVIPDDKYKPVLIVAGMVEGTEKSPEAARFEAFLKGAKARQIFGKYGVK
nr:molybdate ABC transporter substrate-binding protein [uncultured Holophaga sp.]